MIRKLRFIFLIALLASVVASCSDYQKILKSTDYEFKYKKAKEYYDKGDFNRATTLYQEMVNIYRGTSRADIIIWPRVISVRRIICFQGIISGN